jgi:hypothetical protein
MSISEDKRRAPRLLVAIPTLVEKLPARRADVHPNIAAVYERVEPEGSDPGLQFPAVLHDLSTNGCFIAGTPLPLLSRIAFTFPFAEHGQVEAIGWVLWRRRKDTEMPAPGGPTLVRAGFGVLFEAVALDARVAIAKAIESASR